MKSSADRVFVRKLATLGGAIGWLLVTAFMVYISVAMFLLGTLDTSNERQRIVIDRWVLFPFRMLDGVNSKLEEGLATLLSGIFGFAAIALATRAGFQQVVASNNQQHLLQSTRDTDNRNQQRSALTAAVRAELCAMLSVLRSTQTLLEISEDFVPAVQLPDAIIFRENATTIGIMGENLCSEFVEVYTCLGALERTWSSCAYVTKDDLIRNRQLLVKQIDYAVDRVETLVKGLEGAGKGT